MNCVALLPAEPAGRTAFSRQSIRNSSDVTKITMILASFYLQYELRQTYKEGATEEKLKAELSLLLQMFTKNNSLLA